MDNKFNCPVCGKSIIENNSENENNIVIKSRLVFLNNDGDVLGKCLDCRSIVNLPLEFLKKDKIIKNSSNK